MMPYPDKRCMLELLVVMILLTVVCKPVCGHPDGNIPLTACTSMTPGHGTAAQSGRSPYNVIANSLLFIPGVHLTVYLETDTSDVASPPPPFKGFYCQGRNQDNRIIGAFQDVGVYDNITRGHDCAYESDSTGAYSTVSHTLTWRNSPEEFLELYWMMVAEDEPFIKFRCTFVQRRTTFWVGVESPLMSSLVTKNVSDCCRIDHVRGGCQALCRPAGREPDDVDAIIQQVDDAISNGSCFIEDVQRAFRCSHWAEGDRCEDDELSRRWMSVFTVAEQDSDQVLKDCCVRAGVSYECSALCDRYVIGAMDYTDDELWGCIANNTGMVHCLIYPDFNNYAASTPPVFTTSPDEIAPTTTFTTNRISPTTTSSTTTSSTTAGATTPDTTPATTSASPTSPPTTRSTTSSTTISTSVSSTSSRTVSSTTTSTTPTTTTTTSQTTHADSSPSSADPEPVATTARPPIEVMTTAPFEVPTDHATGGETTQPPTVPEQTTDTTNPPTPPPTNPTRSDGVVVFDVTTTVEVTGAMEDDNLKRRVLEALRNDLLIPALSSIDGYDKVIVGVRTHSGSLVVVSEGVFTQRDDGSIPTITEIQESLDERLTAINGRIRSSDTWEIRRPMKVERTAINGLCRAGSCGIKQVCVEVGSDEITCTCLDDEDNEIQCEKEQSGGLAPGGIIGIVIGLLILVAIICLLCREKIRRCFFQCRQRMKKKRKASVKSDHSYVAPDTILPNKEPLYMDISETSHHPPPLPADNRATLPSNSMTYDTPETKRSEKVKPRNKSDSYDQYMKLDGPEDKHTPDTGEYERPIASTQKGIGKDSENEETEPVMPSENGAKNVYIELANCGAKNEYDFAEPQHKNEAIPALPENRGEIVPSAPPDEVVGLKPADKSDAPYDTLF